MKLILLGGLKLEGSPLTRPKPLLLLAYLALEGSRDRRDLAELFFQGSQNPGQGLRVSLAHLNKEATGAIGASEKRLWTELDSDVAELESALATGHYEKALEVYKGPFLEGLELSDLGEELEEWLYKMRERVAAQVREAIVKLAERAASQGKFSEAVSLAEKAYMLRYAPEPETDMLERLYTLLRAGEASTENLVKEAKSYDLELSLTVDEARTKLQTLAPHVQVLPPNPYVGLFAFQESDAAFFFGRERAAHDIIGRCQTSPFVVTVIGNSGAGKSSLVFAGVLPQLRKDNWLICSLRPGRQPFEALGLALHDLLEPSLETSLERQAVASGVQEKNLELTGIISNILSKHPGQKLLIVVDQLEELFTISEGNNETASFLEVSLEAVQGLQDQVSLVVTLRADFIGALLEYPPILTMLQETRYFLGPMNEDELRVAIVEPARKQGVNFEAGLVQRILHDVSGQEGSLPLLEFALTQLWEKQENRTLTHQAYDAIGGVEEALANHADTTFDTLSEVEQQLAKKVFLQLVYPGTGQEDTRRIATREELEDAWGIVQKLASYPARLLVTGYSEIGEQTAEVSHEALIRRWGRLRTWMSDYRIFRTWQERLRQDVKLWSEQRAYFDAKYIDTIQITPREVEATLLRGYRLDEAAQRMGQDDELLGENERKFIGQSLALRERETSEREAQRQEQLESLEKLASEETSRRKAEEARVKLRTNALWLLTLLGCVAGVLAILSYTARNQAVAARNEATVILPKLLSSVALNTKDSLPQRSLLLALEADRIATQNNDPNAPQVQRVLRQLVSETGGLPLPHAAPVRTTAISPDGKWFVTGSDDGNIRFWNQEQLLSQPPDKHPVVMLEAHTDILNSIRFSPDGSWLASGGWDKTIRVWDTSHLPELPTLITALEGLEKTVSDINISPDGNYLGAIGLDNTLQLWRTGGWTLHKRLALASKEAWAVSFSSDGKYLAAGVGNDLDGYVFLWRMDNLEAEPTRLRLEAPVWAVVFSPDHRWLAAGDTHGKLSLWQLEDLEQPEDLEQDVSAQPFVLQGHSDNIIDISFSPQNTWLVSASQDKTLRLYFMADVEKHYPKRNAEGVRATVLRGHEGAVTNLAFSNDEHWLLTGSRDHTARLWNMNVPSSDLTVLPAHGNPERRTEMSPDGTLLASGNVDGTVYLQTLKDTLSSSTVLGKHNSWVESLAFSPQGNYLVSASDASGGGERTLELWNLSEMKAAHFPLTKESKTIFDIAFSNDGKLLASASEDKTAQLWNMDDLSQPLAVFSGHEDIVTDVALSPDNQRLATASFDSFIRIWNVNKADTPLHVLEGHKDGVRTVAFSPDGALFASAGQDGKVKIWSTETWEVVTTLLAGSRVWAIAFSPDSTLLASANEDGSLGLWQVGTVRLEPLQSHTSTAWSVSFSADGKWLVSASEDGTVRFWPVSIDNVRALACQKAGRNLTKNEWQEMFGTMIYQITCPQFSESY